MHTDEQMAVILHEEGHAKVGAVAGSGKTTTMVSRIEQLLRWGADPRRIRVLMFNKSAQEEFSARLRRKMPDAPALPTVQTFHGLGHRLCQKLVSWEDLPDYHLETKESVLGMLAGQALRQEGGARAQSESLEDFLTFITFVKSGFTPAEKIAEKHFDGVFEFDVVAAYELFEENRKKQKIRFFDDLIYDVAKVTKEQPRIGVPLTNHFDFIIVDEYQDVNETQQHLLRVLAGERADVMVVGDVDQCIYEWRGARPDYITRQFEKDFEGAKTYTLTRTFRYGHALSLLANHTIRFNRERDDKLCVSADTCRPTKITAHATNAPHRAIASVVKKALAAGRKMTDIAVLVRLYAMSLSAEVGFLLEGIPYRLEGGRTALDREELKGMMGYFQLAAKTFPTGDRTRDYETALSMLQTPSLGLRRQEVEGLAKRIAANPANASDLIRALTDRDSIHKVVRRKIYDRAMIWKKLAQAAPSMKATELIRMVKTDLDLFEGFRFVSHRAESAFDKELLVDTLEALAIEGNHTVLDFVSFMAGLRKKVEENQRKDDAVLITSAHRAKGLEWPVVIVPNLIDGQFPFYTQKDGLAEVQEEAERRLYYVAITRAQEELHLVHPKCDELAAHIKAHRGHPHIAPKYSRPSRFLFESNIAASNLVGAQIHEGALQPFKGIGTEVLTRYAREIGLELEVEEVKVTVGPDHRFKPLYDHYGRLLHGHLNAVVYHPEHQFGTVIEIRPGAGARNTTRLVVRFEQAVHDMGPEDGLMVRVGGLKRDSVSGELSPS